MTTLTMAKCFLTMICFYLTYKEMLGNTRVEGDASQLR